MKVSRGRGALGFTFAASLLAACLDPRMVVTNADPNLQTLIVTPHPSEQTALVALPLSGEGVLLSPTGEFRAYGYDLSTQALQVPLDRAFGAGEAQACGRAGRALPLPRAVYAGVEGGGLVALEDRLADPLPALTGPPFSARRCWEEGGELWTRDAALYCDPSASPPTPRAPDPPEVVAWPTGCTGLVDCAAELSPCAPGTFRLSRRGACEALSACGATWPAEVTTFVQSGAVGGDGSLARPYGAIPEAVAAGARVIGILSGVYLISDADGLDGLSLIGVCPEETTLELSTTQRVVHPTKLQRLRLELTMDGLGLEVAGGTLELQEVRVGGRAYQALEAAGGSTVSVARVALEGFTSAITAGNAQLDLRQVSVTGYTLTGIGGDPGSVVAVRQAFLASAVSGGPEGRGIALQGARSSHFEDVRIDGYANVAVVVDGGTFRGLDLEVRGPGRSAGDLGAVLLRCPGPGGHQLLRVMVRQAYGEGIQVDRIDSRVECPAGGGIELVDVRTAETEPRGSDPTHSAGMNLSGVPGITLRRFESSGDPRGLSVGDGSGVQAFDLWIHDTRPEDAVPRGALAALCSGCDVHLERVVVEDAPTGVSIGPDQGEVLDLRVRSEFLGLALGDALGLPSRLRARRVLIEGPEVAFRLWQGQLRAQDLVVRGAGTGLWVGGGAALTAELTDAEFEVDRLFEVLTEEAPVILKSSRIQGLVDPASVECLPVWGGGYEGVSAGVGP